LAKLTTRKVDNLFSFLFFFPIEKDDKKKKKVDQTFPASDAREADDDEMWFPSRS